MLSHWFNLLFHVIAYPNYNEYDDIYFYSHIILKQSLTTWVNNE